MTGPPGPPKNCENGSVGMSRVPFTVTSSETTDGSTRLTALTIRSWSLPPLAVSGAALTTGGVLPGPATFVKCVLAKSIIEKLPRIAPMSPTTAVPKNLFIGLVSCSYAHSRSCASVYRCCATTNENRPR
jgi:hypothetical protein